MTNQTPNDFYQPPDVSKSRQGGSVSIITWVIILGGVLVGFLGLGAGALAIFSPDTLAALTGGIIKLPVTSKAITGDPAHFDPVKSYPEVHDYAAPNAELTEIKMVYVRADGTLDLTATYDPPPAVEYDFVVPVPPPATLPPIGAGGSAGDGWYKEVTVTAYQPGRNFDWGNDSSGEGISYTTSKGYIREDYGTTYNRSYPITAAPGCDPQQMWQTAIQMANAPASGVATIDYTKDGYTFDINGTSVHLKFGTDCQIRVD